MTTQEKTKGRVGRKAKKDAIGYLNDLYLIGPEKPMGYLPISTILFECKKDLFSLQKELEKNGITVRILNEGECGIYAGAMYAFHNDILNSFLQKNKTILAEAHWPVTVPEFILQVALVHAPVKTELFDLIADAFGDKANLNRTDVIKDIK